MIRNGVLIVLLATAGQLQAGWITWTNSTTTPGLAASGVFAGGSGAYSGTVSAALSDVTDGLGTAGVPGLDARLYVNGDLTTSFKANYPVNNPGGSFTALANSYNDSGDSYTITVDFSGLMNGYLPAGSLFAILDLDILENYRNVKAFGGTGQINTPWLAARTGTAGLLDWYNIDGDQTGSVAGPTGSEALGVYQFVGPAGNYTSALAGFATTQDISSMSLFFDKSNNSPASPGTGGPGFSIGTEVPEPGTMTLLGIASILGLAFRAARRTPAA